MTKEYPPNIYGGAGVHVTELTRALRQLIDVEVRCFGESRDEQHTTGYGDVLPSSANGASQAMAVNLLMLDDIAGTDLVHSHTWYANHAGQLAAMLYDVPHVLTAHSLEPFRPWKAEQLGGGYRLSSWIEREAYRTADAIVAVSAGMRNDILTAYDFVDPDDVHVIHNGIDTELWRPTEDSEVGAHYGIDPSRPTAIFVGRITRQKGLSYFLRAVALLPADVQVVLCAGAPDTDEIMDEVRGLVEGLRARRDGIFWIEEMLPRHELMSLLSAADVFVCPSVYEPLGIVNLEAMACGTAVVATATGGIPEVVVPGVTGELVLIEQAHDGTGTPLDAEKFIHDFAETLTRVIADPEAADVMGQAGRRRAKQHFSWRTIAEKTIDTYTRVLR